MADAVLDILLISDLHYVEQAKHVCPLPRRCAGLGLILLRKAWLRLQHLGIRPDLIVLLGDAVDNGAADGAEMDLAALASTLQSFGVPYLAVRGNHDGPVSVYERVFGTTPGLHLVNEVGLLVFNDTVAHGGVTTRHEDGLRLVDETVRRYPGLPLVALQHNPMHPAIVSEYPYMLTNGNEILDGYARAGVVASLSGHYHAGQVPAVLDGVTYYTVPALCESPFTFAHLRVEGRRVQVQEHVLH